MPRYLMAVKYTPEGAKAAQADGYAARQSMNEQSFTTLGGHLERWFWTGGGDYDLIAIGTLPDGAMATLKTVVDRSGTFARSTTIELFDSVTMDAVAATATGYRPPGQA